MMSARTWPVKKTAITNWNKNNIFLYCNFSATNCGIVIEKQMKLKY